MVQRQSKARRSLHTRRHCPEVTLQCCLRGVLDNGPGLRRAKDVKYSFCYVAQKHTKTHRNMVHLLGAVTKIAIEKRSYKRWNNPRKQHHERPRPAYDNNISSNYIAQGLNARRYLYRSVASRQESNSLLVRVSRMAQNLLPNYGQERNNMQMF